MPKVITTGTVVEEYMLGNTKIKICNDAYINRTPEEIEESLKRINDICLRCVLSSGYNQDAKEPGVADEAVDQNPCAGDK